MMQYIEAPDYDAEVKYPSLFMAGGITNCRDWQRTVREQLKFTPVTLFNPRRASFDVSARGEGYHQILWEHVHLHDADAIMFWFSSETVQPITLFELGAHLRADKPVWIGVDPRYERAFDVYTQVSLGVPLKPVWSDLSDMTEDIHEHFVHVDRAKRSVAMAKYYTVPS